MVTLEVLKNEMGVEELGVGPGSEGLVVPLSLVEELVATDGVHSSEVAPLEDEEGVLPVGLWLHLEPWVINLDNITADDESPQPGAGLEEVLSVQWDPESLVVVECFLTLWAEVLVVIWGIHVAQWAGEVHDDNWDGQFAGVSVDDVRKNKRP